MYITLRPLEEKDAYTSWRWRNDPEVFANTGRRYSGPVTLEDELQWIRTVLARPDERRFAILAGEEYIGNMYLTGINNIEAEVSTLIGDKRYWNKIAGSRALSLTIQYALKELGLKYITTTIRKEHTASLRLGHKIGFKEVGENNEFIYLKLSHKTFNPIFK